MGIDSDRFAYGIPQDAHCFLCCGVLENPVEIVECGHYFCIICLESWRKKHSADDFTCPYCGISLFEDSYRRSTLLWNLVQNTNVHCKHKSEGCDVIYKYGFEGLHLEVCAFQNTNNNNNEKGGDDTEENGPKKCPTCKVTLSLSINSHDCVRELAAQLKEQKAILTNVKHENQRLVSKLSTCENRFFEERSELESQFYLDTLRFNKEIRDLRTRVAHFQGEIGIQSGKLEQEDIYISLDRLNGSLGFNIVGGASKNNDSVGIFISRIVEGGAADKPGKLKLHDQILEVDDKDLRQATHEVAVDSFRASGNSVKMLIRRQVRKTKAVDVSTQTQLKEPCKELNTKKGEWFDPMTLITSADLSSPENKEYDSAYDTLNKSSRCSQQAPSTLAAPSDEEESARSTNTERTLTTTPFYKESVSAISDQSSNKRHPTFSVEDEEKDHFDMSIGNTTECEEADFECEYEEVVLQKRNGKFGVQLCYGGDEHSLVSLYVGDVEENSSADINGKIMVGDEIVQINTCRVNNVEEAYRMFEENKIITLVVARPVYENPTDLYDEAEETDLDMLDCIVEEDIELASKASSPTYASSVSSRSSDKNSPPQCLSPPIVNGEEYTNTTLDETSKKHDSSVKTSEPKVKNSLKNFMKNKLSGGHQKDKRAGSQSDDSLDFNKLPRCDSNSSSNNSNKSQKARQDIAERSGNDVMKARLKEQRQQSKIKAYMDSPSINRYKPPSNVSLFQAPYMINTGAHMPVSYHGVSNMTPVFVNPPRFSPTPLHYQQVNHQSYNMSASVSSLRSAMKNSQLNNRIDKVQDRPRTNKRVSIDPHPGWNETEKRVWEEFKIIQNMEKEGTADREAVHNIIELGNPAEAEWRVRRSKDGKHIYIKKTNTSRSKVLKDRAQQINNERCGMTTDDDAFTVYQGQYWSRDQRKKQLLRHNERRKKLVQKAELKASYENKTEKEIAELAQRNMTMPVFDNFVTIDEILSQRNRSGVFAGPVHVTTI